ncbi:actin binding protein [Spiromyces aspiralis]|uniref:Actin binding protein n=1 Tax=Spiromyces aspiralis TaxID=68401 RepID=A0ACC1HTK0_9FUNG|nr:actin binding protein [Spiromyces aspiralis]
MARQIDFSTYADELHSTHQRILDGDPEISWALYGLGRNLSLRVENQSNAPLEDLLEEFDESKIQYAFARVTDPNTKLPKFIFLSWCGNGVPVVYRGIFGTQMNDVRKVLGSYHVEITARTNDDLDVNSIMQQIERSSGANYSYHSSKPKPPSARKPPQPARPTTKPTYTTSTARTGGPPPSVPPKAIGPTTTGSTTTATARLGGTKPLFGGPSAGKPVSAIFGGYSAAKPMPRSPPPKPAAAVPRVASPARSQSDFNDEPEHTEPVVVTSARTQADERRAELEALRKRSISRGTNPFIQGSTSPKKSFASVQKAPSPPAEPGANSLSQAEQTKSELELLRNRRLLQSDLGASQYHRSSRPEADERKAELENLRKSRTESVSRDSSSTLGTAGGRPQRGASVSGANNSSSIGMPQAAPPPPPPPPVSASVPVAAAAPPPPPPPPPPAPNNVADPVLVVDPSPSLPPPPPPPPPPVLVVAAAPPPPPPAPAAIPAAAPPPPPPPPQPATVAAVVGPAPEAVLPAPSQQSGIKKARVLHPYAAEDTDEMDLIDNEIIDIIEEIEGWMIGRSQDGERSGMFPGNFVEIIEEHGLISTASAVSPPQPPALPQRNTGPSEPPPPPLPARNNGGSSSAAAPPLPPRNAPGASAALPPPPSRPEDKRAKALYDYEVDEGDEIGFKTGEIITEVELVSEEWWQGKNAHGQIGLFPANFVELL